MSFEKIFSVAILGMIHRAAYLLVGRLHIFPAHTTMFPQFFVRTLKRLTRS